MNSFEVILVFILGFACIIFGVQLIVYYRNIVKLKKKSTLSFRIQTGGIGSIMIGIALLFKSCN